MLLGGMVPALFRFLYSHTCFRIFYCCVILSYGIAFLCSPCWKMHDKDLIAYLKLSHFALLLVPG